MSQPMSKQTDGDVKQESEDMSSKTPPTKSTDDEVAVDEKTASKSTPTNGHDEEPAAKSLKSSSRNNSEVDNQNASAGPETKSSAGYADRDFNRFPEKLLKILDSEEYCDIFSWSASGKSFVIHKPYDLISQVLTKHFDAKEDMKFDSFLRKLYRWGFSKKTADDEEGDEEGAHIYFHSNFRRGDFDLCAKVTCTSKPATSRPSAHQKNDMNFMMPYGAGMIHPQMSMVPGLVPIMNVPQANALMGRNHMQGQAQQLGSLFQNSALGVLPAGSCPPLVGRTGAGDMFLQQHHQEMRERELLLLQQQQLYGVHPGSLLGGVQAGALNNRLPPLPFEQQQFPGGVLVPQVNLQGNGLDSSRLGQDIGNRFDRDMLRFQQGNAMLGGGQPNNALGGLMPGQDHRRLMYDAQAGMLVPTPAPSSLAVDQMLAAERQVFGDRSLIDRSLLGGRNMSGIGMPGSSTSDEQELIARQRRMLLASQEAQQNLLLNSNRKREINGISSNHQSSSKEDLQPDAKRANR